MNRGIGQATMRVGDPGETFLVITAVLLVPLQYISTIHSRYLFVLRFRSL